MTEVQFKLMRSETILQILQRVYQENRQNYQAAAVRTILGMTVLTRYNNKTYRIDDIDFKTKPSDTFESRGQPITFIDYFKQVKFDKFVNSLANRKPSARPIYLIHFYVLE